jgi:hypothetical protein
MLLEEKIIYEIKKENFKKVRDKHFLKTLEECILLERNLLRRGLDREEVNLACIDLIEHNEKIFRAQIIEEGVLDSVVGFLAPGLGDYFKKLFIQYVFRKLNINPDSPLAGFFVNVLRNIKYTELYQYFKTGKCPYIVESLTKAVFDQLLDYIKGQLFAGAIKSQKLTPYTDKYGEMKPGSTTGATPTYEKPAGGFAGYDEESSFLQSAGEKLVDMSLPKEFLQFFQSSAGKNIVGGGIEEILRTNVKDHLMPPLIRSFQKVICEGLDYKALGKSIKSQTTKDKESKKAGDKNKKIKTTDSGDEKLDQPGTEEESKENKKRYYS